MNDRRKRLVGVVPIRRRKLTEDTNWAPGVVIRTKQLPTKSLSRMTMSETQWALTNFTRSIIETLIASRESPFGTQPLHAHSRYDQSASHPYRILMVAPVLNKSYDVLDTQFRFLLAKVNVVVHAIRNKDYGLLEEQVRIARSDARTMRVLRDVGMLLFGYIVAVAIGGLSSGEKFGKLPVALLTEGWNPIHVYYGKRNLITDDIPSNWRLKGVAKNEGGDEWFGQHGQDVAIAKFFNFKRNGFFVDLAANDAVWASNTFALESNFDWKGLCIEPNPFYWFRLSFRKCHAVGTFVGARNLDEVNVKLGFSKVAGPYSGIVGDGFDNKKASGDEAQRRYTASLKHIFEVFSVPKVIDYISLDVEGAEEFIMGTFPFSEYRFLTMTVERPKEELRRLLEKNGMRFVMDFKRGDTLWAHESVYKKGKALLDKNTEDIDAHKVKELPSWA
jgi:Methyltransferase FkbM domain